MKVFVIEHHRHIGLRLPGFEIGHPGHALGGGGFEGDVIGRDDEQGALIEVAGVIQRRGLHADEVITGRERIPLQVFELEVQPVKLVLGPCVSGFHSRIGATCGLKSTVATPPLPLLPPLLFNILLNSAKVSG